MCAIGIYEVKLNDIMHGVACNTHNTERYNLRQIASRAALKTAKEVFYEELPCWT